MCYRWSIDARTRFRQVCWPALMGLQQPAGRPRRRRAGRSDLSTTRPKRCKKLTRACKNTCGYMTYRSISKRGQNGYSRDLCGDRKRDDVRKGMTPASAKRHVLTLRTAGDRACRRPERRLGLRARWRVGRGRKACASRFGSTQHTVARRDRRILYTLIHSSPGRGLCQKKNLAIRPRCRRAYIYAAAAPADETTPPRAGPREAPVDAREPHGLRRRARQVRRRENRLQGEIRRRQGLRPPNLREDEDSSE